jgi:hypothetical protein
VPQRGPTTPARGPTRPEIGPDQAGRLPRRVSSVELPGWRSGSPNGYPAALLLPRLPPAGSLGRLAAIGRAPADDTDTRLRKATLTPASASITVLASAWTLTSLALGRPASAASPFTYQLASVLSLAVLAGTRCHEVFRVSQGGLMVCLPGRVQTSLTTRERLRHGCRFRHRGTSEVKGRGPMGASLLPGRRPERSTQA